MHIVTGLGAAGIALVLLFAGPACAQERACKSVRGINECVTDFGAFKRTEWSTQGIVTAVEVAIRDGDLDNTRDQAAALSPVIDMLSPRSMSAREHAAWITLIVVKVRRPDGKRLRLGNYEWRARIDANGALIVDADYTPQHR